MKRAWLAFALAFALAVGTAVTIGWLRYDKLEPQARASLTPSNTVEIRNLVFTLEGFKIIEVSDDDAAVPVPDGTVWVALALRQEVLAPAEREYEDDWYCSIELVTDYGTWQTQSSTMGNLDMRTGCTADYDAPPFAAGDVTTTYGLWLVPEHMLVNPRVLIQFTPPPAAFEVVPEWPAGQS